MFHNLRSERFSLSALALALLVFAALCSAQRMMSQDAKLTENLPAGPMQAKAISSCQECHEARIILQQRLTKSAWTKEVDKMTKWGALVDPSDRDALIEYLSSNFGPDRPPYEPERAAKSTKKNVR